MPHEGKRGKTFAERIPHTYRCKTFAESEGTMENECRNPKGRLFLKIKLLRLCRAKGRCKTSAESEGTFIFENQIATAVPSEGTV